MLKTISRNNYIKNIFKMYDSKNATFEAIITYEDQLYATRTNNKTKLIQPGTHTQVLRYVPLN